MGVDQIVLPDDRLPHAPLMDQGEVQQEPLQPQDLIQLPLPLLREAFYALADRSPIAAGADQRPVRVPPAGVHEAGQGLGVSIAQLLQLLGLQHCVSSRRLQNGVEGIVIGIAVPGRADQPQIHLGGMGPGLLRLQSAVADEPQQIGPQQEILPAQLTGGPQPVGHVQIAVVGRVPEVVHLIHPPVQLGPPHPGGGCGAQGDGPGNGG